jgi:transcriptional regulator with XRE-family HTH domain
VTETKHNGTAIRTFREMRAMSRDDLAQKIGKSYPYLANIELENKEPPAETLNAIALALDVPIAAILRRPLYAQTAA